MTQKGKLHGYKPSGPFLALGGCGGIALLGIIALAVYGLFIPDGTDYWERAELTEDSSLSNSPATVSVEPKRKALPIQPKPVESVEKNLELPSTDSLKDETQVLPVLMGVLQLNNDLWIARSYAQNDDWSFEAVVNWKEFGDEFRKRASLLEKEISQVENKSRMVQLGNLLFRVQHTFSISGPNENAETIKESISLYDRDLEPLKPLVKHDQ